MEYYMKLFNALFLTLLIYSPSFAQVTADDISYDFECASLQSASTVDTNHINLTLRLDDQHGDLYGWYYFKIDRNASGQTVTFCITNRDGWMNQNHKPVGSYDNENWFRIHDTWMSNNDMYFRHTFDEDSARIALTFPYTYTDLFNDLDSLSASPYFSYEIIGQSVNGRDIPLVTIEDPNAAYPYGKKCAWLTSRQHPMETPPSFMLKAMMKHLIGWGAPGGEKLLDKTVFKIVPVINVDGAAEGFSRHNANGINLNRNWCYDSTYTGEEPEVEAVHRAIDEWIYAGNEVHFLDDFHAAPDLYDFGYRISESFSDPQYYEDEETFLKSLERWNPHQHWNDWRDLDHGYARGIIILALYTQHGLMGLSNEHSWSRRGSGNYHTIEDLMDEGEDYIKAIDEYLFPAKFCDSYGQEIDTVRVGDEVHMIVIDFDENHDPNGWERFNCRVSAEFSGDSELISMRETGQSTGIFLSLDHLSVINDPDNHPNNGLIEISGNDNLIGYYRDSNFPQNYGVDYIPALIATSVDDPGLPENLEVTVNAYPNPFNASTNFNCCLPSPKNIKLDIFNIRGQLVTTLMQGFHERGNHSVIWKADGFTSGLYFYRLKYGDQYRTGRVSLIK
ncbi:MAG: T9SS type A sorting domain-containing protein [candidate division Zixibacteria bacterium]|nr:T9SS type A sorting domain-containing protein [candidate division Zixibacteria bacterium]